MASPKSTLAVLALATTVLSITPPTYSGYTLKWSEPFTGNVGTLPSTSVWNTITGYLDVNDELEVYTTSDTNVQLSGGSTLQLIPQTDASSLHGWTSGRVESVESWTPLAGAITRLEAKIDFGTDAESTKQGLWPAFWLLPESYRLKTQQWPTCGELDIMEAIDGVMTGYGTVHCGTECNDYPDSVGLQESVAIPDDGAHVWRLEWNRTGASWEQETIKWSFDGVVFHTIVGSSFAESVWDNLAHQPYYVILNMAVGGTGSWPGAPNSATLGEWGAMMEVFYVAIYTT